MEENTEGFEPWITLGEVKKNSAAVSWRHAKAYIRMAIVQYQPGICLLKLLSAHALS